MAEMSRQEQPPLSKLRTTVASESLDCTTANIGARKSSHALGQSSRSPLLPLFAKPESWQLVFMFVVGVGMAMGMRMRHVTVRMPVSVHQVGSQQQVEVIENLSCRA